MLDLNKVKARAKEGGHYSHWLFVYQLIAEIEELRSQLILLTSDANSDIVLDEEDNDA